MDFEKNPSVDWGWRKKPALSPFRIHYHNQTKQWPLFFKITWTVSKNQSALIAATMVEGGRRRGEIQSSAPWKVLSVCLLLFVHVTTGQSIYDRLACSCSWPTVERSRARLPGWLTARPAERTDGHGDEADGSRTPVIQRSAAGQTARPSWCGHYHSSVGCFPRRQCARNLKTS